MPKRPKSQPSFSPSGHSSWVAERVLKNNNNVRLKTHTHKTCFFIFPHPARMFTYFSLSGASWPFAFSSRRGWRAEWSSCAAFCWSLRGLLFHTVAPVYHSMWAYQRGCGFQRSVTEIFLNFCFPLQFERLNFECDFFCSVFFFAFVCNQSQSKQVI